MESSEKTEKYKVVEPLEFKENDVPIVCYDESVIGDCDETTIRNYLALHAERYPEIKKNIDDGAHTFEACMRYIVETVRKMRGKDNSSVMVSSDRVFRLAVNFYMSPVVEKERRIEHHSPAPVSDWSSPEAAARREEEARKRREEEAERKRQADIQKNGLSLFDF